MSGHSTSVLRRKRRKRRKRRRRRLRRRLRLRSNLLAIFLMKVRRLT
jgi:hypothetical protein